MRIIVLSHGEPSDAYVRLRANGLLALLSWDQLRLSLEETTAIVFQRRPELDRNLVESLHQQADGWVAGLVLLLEQRFDMHLVTNTRQS
ncbi:bacterial transcriptional activator domain protein [Methylocaldum marinum]|uniref:Bacterial transcriptional activator domain protein n=2 Tax=Methylocaldum marinum TaxID=1432792 RepID=A0A250KP32_9GAMM|nr:bacterial transcriptional activator domain protein [Methylocaldum marinum]